MKMKTKIFTLILSFVLLLLVSCKAEPQKETETTTFNNQTTTEANQSEESSETDNSDSNFILVLQTVFDANDNEISRCEYTYDEFGNKKSELRYLNGELTQRTDSTHDADQMLVREVYTSFNMGVAESYIYDYEYDENGNMTTRRMMDTNGYLSILTYEYDETGKLIKTTDSNNSQTVYSYPDENTCIILSQSGDGKTFSQTKEIYDNSGNLIRQISYQQNSYEEIDYEIANTYNEYGQQLASELYMKGVLNSGLYSEYEGDRCVCTTHQNAESIYLIEEYEYDQYGNLLKKVSKTSSGLIMYYSVHEYDIVDRP